MLDNLADAVMGVRQLGRRDWDTVVIDKGRSALEVVKIALACICVITSTVYNATRMS